MTKSFLLSKTFWSAIAAVSLEFLSAVEKLPFLSEDWAHGISIAVLAFIAINRALKNRK